MPNRPALIGAGATACTRRRRRRRQRALAEQVLASRGPHGLGANARSDLDAVTALSGSGPAYFFRLAEHMAAAGVALGLDADMARAAGGPDTAGAGQLAHADPDLAAQRAAVTSKGGTTEAALGEFAARGLAALVRRAVDAAARRSRELGRQFGSGG